MTYKYLTTKYFLVAICYSHRLRFGADLKNSCGWLETTYSQPASAKSRGGLFVKFF